MKLKAILLSGVLAASALTVAACGSDDNDTTTAATTAPAATMGETIAAAAAATPDLSTLVAALKAADLVTTLEGEGPYTVFAPTNEAFAAIQRRDPHASAETYVALYLDPHADVLTIRAANRK